MTIPLTAVSKASTRKGTDKAVAERVSDRKAQIEDKIKTGDILEGYKNQRKGI